MCCLRRFATVVWVVGTTSGLKTPSADGWMVMMIRLELYSLAMCTASVRSSASSYQH